MTKNDFIFSNERHHRVARHLSFWMIWAVAYFLLFHCPIYEFKGWGFNPTYAPMTFADIEKIGLPMFILRSFIFQSLLSVVVPQAIFTYLLIYWILPNYFYKKRSLIVVMCILIGTLVIHLLAVAQFKWFTIFGRYLTGTLKKWPEYRSFFNVVLNSSLRDQLSSLPIVAGYAVMIKLVKRWWTKHKEAEQLVKEKNRAVIQLLKAQVHPHFLFNTLNNIYFLTRRNSAQGSLMIKKLSGMLHYIMSECNQPLVPVDKEIMMIKDYIALEEIRYGEQMKLDVNILVDHSGYLIAPLLLIPFVENSFKHGASKMLSHAYVKIDLRAKESFLHFSITNSRPKIPESAVTKNGFPRRHGQLGLKNARKRLELLYPGTHQLNINSKLGGFTVELKIHLGEPAVLNTENKANLTASYATA